jgi:GDP-L-fucose synthase
MIRKFHLAMLAQQKNWRRIEQDEKRFGPIPNEIRKALGIPPFSQGNPEVILWGTGSPRREFLHVDDLADACVFLMAGRQGMELINIGAGEDLTIADLALTVAHVLGYEGRIIFDSSKPDGTPRKLLDISRIRGLGWSPRISLEQGVRDVHGWYLREIATQERKRD